MDFQEVLSYVTNNWDIILQIIGGASAVVFSLRKLLGVIPGDQYEEEIGKINGYIKQFVTILDKISLNPDETEARPKTKKIKKDD